MNCISPVTIKNPSVCVDFTNTADGLGYINPITGEYLPKEIQVPCGKCLFCQENRRNEWATRLELETRTSKASFFVTLTYAPEFCPDELKLEDVQRFFKRLRKVLGKVKLRYFLCGEYGDRFQRPHYHFIAWLNKFMDENAFSQLIVQSWTFGFHKLDSVNYNRCRYVAKYTLKDYFGVPEGRKAPFAVMSRRPGISFPYFDTLISYCHDYVYLVSGNRAKLPDYLLKKLDQVEQYRIKRDRRNYSTHEDLKTLEDFAKQESQYLAIRNSIIRKMNSKYGKQREPLVNSPAKED